MKRVLAGLVVGALFLGLFGLVGLGQRILVLSEQCGPSVAYFPAALSGLGLEFIETNDDFDFFFALIDDGPWDLVIVDEYSSRLDPETIDAIADYIDSGGRLYMNYWDWYEDTASLFEALWLSDYEEPLPIYVWDEAHPLFTTPNVVTVLWPTADTCIVDGALFSAVEGGLALAGYTPDRADDQVAIIVGNAGRTVLFGGILGLFAGDANGDGRTDGLEFAENVVAFLLGVPVVRPLPLLWTAVTPADIDRLLSEMELGFEQATSEDGNPVWVLELAGVPVELSAHGDAEESYDSLRLSTSWAVSAQTASPLIYAWNLTRRGTRAYANRDGGLSLDADLYLVGGINWRSVRAFIERFGQAIPEFEAHLRLLQ